MTERYTQQPAIRRIAKGIVGFVKEWNDAQRRLLEIRVGPERYVFASSRAPDTFAEFMYRTSGTLPHEPTAEERAGNRHLQ